MVRTVRLVGAVASLALLIAAGCSSPSLGSWHYPHAGAATLGLSPHEHREGISRMARQQRLALIEDLDVFFQTDRPTRLLRWHGR
jgi:hypothetical protein